jgi:predicted DNA-binding protein (MmcQ/YjbR family)
MATAAHKRAELRLRDYALRFPEAHEEFPWGERVVKVRGKIFVFLGGQDGELRVSVKLPISFEMALELPFTAPTGYGLGRARWVTARFAKKEKPPIDLLQDWILQSYRAVAPKKLAAQTETRAGVSGASKGGSAKSPRHARARGARASKRSA